ncbi:probable polygalacturonase At3g15720 [Phoenix dactylifera]|uniref:Probable polygalacturonase At3g15720 n=1 Tax=Phoenix dactylifera TaxID=42345 RepID=A0A8B9AW16_PHODC|nr:probable polygalacturonase At3g15720 [Phoenix dactylifera]
MKAWTTACIFSTGWPTILIPSGKTFLLSPLTFEGPCLYASVHVRVEGNIVAPDKLWTSQNNTSWITFRDVTAFTVDGNGEIDGRGSVWWDCKKKNKCDSVPSALGILRCVDLTIAGMKLLNSPGKHLTVDSSKWVHLKGLSFASPADSPDTDGIYIVESHYVEVKDAAIGAGNSLNQDGKLDW